MSHPRDPESPHKLSPRSLARAASIQALNCTIDIDTTHSRGLSSPLSILCFQIPSLRISSHLISPHPIPSHLIPSLLPPLTTTTTHPLTTMMHPIITLITLTALTALAAAAPPCSYRYSAATPSSTPTPSVRPKICTRICAPERIATCGEGWGAERLGVSFPLPPILERFREVSWVWLRRRRRLEK